MITLGFSKKLTRRHKTLCLNCKVSREVPYLTSVDVLVPITQIFVIIASSVVVTFWYSWGKMYSINYALLVGFLQNISFKSSTFLSCCTMFTTSSIVTRISDFDRAIHYCAWWYIALPRVDTRQKLLDRNCTPGIVDGKLNHKHNSRITLNKCNHMKAKDKN